MHNLETIRILVADGHRVVASGIAKVLEDVRGFRVIGLAKTGDETFGLFENHSPNVLLIDIDLPGSISGLEIIRRLRNTAPRTRVLILTNLLDDVIIRDALREGVVGYLLKNASTTELVDAVRAAIHDIPTLSPEVTKLLIRQAITPSGYHLTSREQEVLELVAEGLNNHEIAKRLYISLSTVQFHVSNILNKLSVHNRIEAATFAVRHKLAS
jgi:DNA-binding NarL/FixJ family response regulator